LTSNVQLHIDQNQSPNLFAALGSVPGGVRSVHPGASLVRSQGQPGDDSGLPSLHAGQPRLHGHSEAAVEPHRRQFVPHPGLIPRRILYLYDF